MMANKCKTLRWFTTEMQKKLTANNHRGKFENLGFRFCLQRFRQETDELLIAMVKYNIANIDENLPEAARKAIIDECADIANFAMGIADSINRRKNARDG
jgi:hypothetical protein